MVYRGVSSKSLVGKCLKKGPCVETSKIVLDDVPDTFKVIAVSGIGIVQSTRFGFTSLLNLIPKHGAIVGTPSNYTGIISGVPDTSVLGRFVDVGCFK